MYISSFLTLDTALSGVEAAQEELDTTGANISNASTTDYEEQTVNLVESPSLSIFGSADSGSYQLGEGVDAQSVTNSGDPYLDAAWRQQNANTQSATTTQSFLQQIQTALDEPSSSGISSQLSTFWTDWDDLATNPTAPASQQAVVDSGEELGTALNDLNTELNGSDLSDPSDSSNSGSVLGQATDQYNDLTEAGSGAAADGGEIYNDAYNISSLNQSIIQAQAAGQSANTLIDQRNEALDDLSSLGNVTVQNNTDGSVTVFFGGIGDPSTGSGALVTDPSAAAAAGAAPIGSGDPGNNFTNWQTALGNAYDSAATAGTSASSFGSSFGGTIGSLISLAGYSSTGFGVSNAAVTQATAVASYNNLLTAPSEDQADGGEVSTAATALASLNQQIYAISGGAAVSSLTSSQQSQITTLQTEASQELNGLATIGNVTTGASATAYTGSSSTASFNSDGTLTVNFGGVSSQTLVSDPSGSTASGAGDDFTAWSSAFSTLVSGGGTAATVAATVGGQLGTFISAAGIDATTGQVGDPTANDEAQLGTIGTLTVSLNGFAQTLANEVNDVAVVNGGGLSVTTDPQFFTASDGSGIVTAANIAVSSTLTANPAAIQIASTGYTSSSDNDVADDETNNSGGAADEAYQSFVQEVGSLAQGANNSLSTQSALTTQITNQRDSVEGVDLDNEMSNLINEQQAYQASAKVMNAFSTVMDSLMSVVGQS